MSFVGSLRKAEFKNKLHVVPATIEKTDTYQPPSKTNIFTKTSRIRFIEREER